MDHLPKYNVYTQYVLKETAIRNDFSTSFFFLENKIRELVNSANICQKIWEKHRKMLNFSLGKKYNK